LFVDWNEEMDSTKPLNSMAAKLSRAERQLLASQEAAGALADAEQHEIAVRKNMTRLRALREAREAEQARAQASRSAGFNERPKKRFSR
jgi:hypothetical protein